MNKHTIKQAAMAAGALATIAMGVNVQAQSSDALLDKLVDKGILTVKEANELKEESDKGFSQALQVKNGMPDWVSSFKINGDFRGRYESFYSDSSYAPAAGPTEPFVDRHRFRYRLRLGFVANMSDKFEVGMRLASGAYGTDPRLGADPISTNQTLGNNGSKKSVFIDLAYAKWSPINTTEWSGAFTLGKMENPFVFSDMVFDGDYTPEGLAQQFGYNLSDKQALKLNLGEFILTEIGGSNQDAYLGGAQLRLESNWSPKIHTSIGVSALAITGSEGLFLATGGSAVPDINAGNTRNKGVLVNDYNPVVVDGSVTYNLSSFPGYAGVFPIKLGGDYMNNTAVGNENQAYSVGITFGKSGKKKTWDIGYRWKHLEADAWFEEVVDSDFGAFWGREPVSAKSGYYSGTNIQGHIVKASYSPYDQLTFGITYFVTELINNSPANTKSDMGRLQLDALWKF